MEKIMIMNNQAADMIGESRYAEALHMLKTALQSVQHTITNTGENPARENAATVCHRVLEQSSRRRTKLHGIEDTLCDGKIYIYRHAIRADASLLLNPEQNVYSLSVILVFNMALAHHIAAIDSKQSEMSLGLEGALKLYELGFQMQQQCGNQMSMTYVVALLNNCAHVYKVLNKPTKSHRLYQHMLSSLLLMVQNGEAHTIDELEGFWWNASQLILQNHCVAAAA